MSMDPAVAAGISYFLIIGLIFFFIEKQNRFVRFHAMQSIFLAIIVVVLSILWIPISTVLGIVTLGIGFLLSSCLFGLIFLAIFVGWLLALINAFQGKYFKLPLLGNWADSIVSKPVV
jgi:uncharacterized membrane protein